MPERLAVVARGIGGSNSGRVFREWRAPLAACRGRNARAAWSWEGGDQSAGEPAVEADFRLVSMQEPGLSV